MKRFGWIGWVVAGAVVGGLIWRELSKPHAPVPPTVPRTHDAGAVSVPRPSDAAAPADAPPAALYTVSEALDDVASSPLTFIGTGEWFGNASIHACAYRNDRVIAVSEYCTAKETPAFSLVVLSPARGRVSIYAEAPSAISTLSRADYFSFTVDVQPPFAEPLALSASYADLRAWDERRYNAGLPGCYAKPGEKQCPPELAPQLAAWAPSAEAFVETPPASWYALVKDFHARAVRDSRR